MTMPVPDISQHNIMETWLFDTCNFNCGYCGLVANGMVKDKTQLDPYKSRDHIDRIVRFFAQRRPGARSWALTLTGGEPLLMPNFGYFAERMHALGDKIAIYSNFSAPLSSVMDRAHAGVLAYVHASIHPDWTLGHLPEDRFFDNVALARQWGVPVLVRFVASPHLLEKMDAIAERCAAIGVSFFPTTLFDPDYPRSYTPDQRATIASRMLGYSSLLQLEGGVKIDAWRRCRAGNRLFATRLHQGGDITPCVSTASPVFGNIFDNILHVQGEWNPCYKADALCSCDVHFQQKLIEGIDDHDEHQSILAGRGVARAHDFEQWRRANHIETDDAQWAGQGAVTGSAEALLRPR